MKKYLISMVLITLILTSPLVSFAASKTETLESNIYTKAINAAARYVGIVQSNY